MNILDEIVARKREEIASQVADLPVGSLKERAMAAPPVPSFSEALRSVPVGLIAEVKHRSPSAGTIRVPFVPADIASVYQAAGAQAVSVLIDEHYFGGGADDFAEVRSAIALPMLYKEFVIDPWQVWHARSSGASAVLLIAGVLDVPELKQFIANVDEAGLQALVEVHDEEQMAMAIEAGARIIGVNNRDLTTFTVSLETSERLAQMAPGGCTLISESGIRSAADVARVKAAGYHAVLVGEQLLRQVDLAVAVRELMGAV